MSAAQSHIPKLSTLYDWLSGQNELLNDPSGRYLLAIAGIAFAISAASFVLTQLRSVNKHSRFVEALPVGAFCVGGVAVLLAIVSSRV